MGRLLHHGVGEDVDAEGAGVLGVDAVAVGALGEFPAAGESEGGEDDGEVSVDGGALEVGGDA